MLNEIDLSKIKVNNGLSFLFEDENTLNPIYRDKLLNIFYFFSEKLIGENQNIINILDVTLTGSLVNYNYNENSDIDLHIIVKDDYELLSTKAKLFNLKYNIKMEDHFVEVYVQKYDEQHSSTGVYSLLKNKWLVKPDKKINISLDKKTLEKKYNYFLNQIDIALASDNIKFIKNIIDKIKKFRQRGLENNGEYSVENIVFKLLRYDGYLKKIYDHLSNIEIKNVLK